MSLSNLTTKQVPFSLLVLMAELILFCTVGTPKSSFVQALGMMFAIVVYLPAALILRGLLLTALAKRWSRNSISLIEKVAKWVAFVAPIFAIGCIQLANEATGETMKYLGQFLAYLAFESAICHLYLRITEKWAAL
jgi:hypothetical protein